MVTLFSEDCSQLYSAHNSRCPKYLTDILKQASCKVLSPTRLAFLIYQQLYSTSSSIKTGRAGIFLCRATCVEQSTS